MPQSSVGVIVHIKFGPGLKNSTKLVRGDGVSFPVQFQFGRGSTEHSFPRFSEGTESDFAEFSSWAAAQAGRGVHIDFTLGGDLRKAFHGFVQADAIAFGQSSFAQLAAIYNGGKHYYWPVQSCLWDPEAMPLGCTENSMSTKVCKGMAAACRAPALMPSASTPA